MEMNIPEKHAKGLTLLFTMDDEKFEAVIDALQNMPAVLTTDKLPELLSKLTGGLISREDFDFIIKPLVSLNDAVNSSPKKEREESRINFAKDLYSDLKQHATNKVGGLTTHDKRNAERLLRILSIEGFLKWYRAVEQIQKHQSAFLRTEIINDIRPVFDEFNEKELLGNVVVHVMKIRYRNIASAGSKPEEIYLALDTDDLRLLEEAIQLCREQLKVIEASLESANVPYFRFNGNED